MYTLSMNEPIGDVATRTMADPRDSPEVVYSFPVNKHILGKLG